MRELVQVVPGLAGLEQQGLQFRVRPHPRNDLRLVLDDGLLKPGAGRDARLRRFGRHDGVRLGAEPE